MKTYIVLACEHDDDAARYAAKQTAPSGKVVAVRTSRQEAIKIACQLPQWATIEEWEPNAEKGKVIWNSLMGFFEFA